MPPDPIKLAGGAVDLSRRFQSSQAIVGSPALAAETIIAQLTIVDSLVIASGVFLEGWCAFTVGTSGTNSTLRIRQTNVSGTIIANSGGLTTAAAALFAPLCKGVDTAAVLPGQVYVLTLQVTAGAATSTVSAVSLQATIV